MQKKHMRFGRLLCIALCVVLTMGANADVLPVEAAKNTIVRIYVEHYYQGSYVTSFIGSGFVVGEENDDARYVVTNQHVVDDHLEDELTGEVLTTTVKVYVVYDNIRNMISADIVAKHQSLDMAVVRANKTIPDRQQIPIAPFESQDIVGDTVYSMGFPAASDDIMSQNAGNMLYSDVDKMTWAEGKVIRVIESDKTVSSAGEIIQTNATINGGNSGGPLINDQCGVIGICSFGTPNGENTFYAISVNELVDFLDKNNIRYTEQKGTAGGTVWAILFLGVAALVVLAVIVLKQRRQTPTPEPTPVPTPTPAPTPTPVRELLCIAGALEGRKYPIKGSVTIGRDPKRCQIVCAIDTKGVSAVHCTVSFDGQKVVVVDQGSTYGTYLNSQKLPPNTPVVMHRGQKLSLGTQMNTFLLGGSSGR